MPNGFSNCNSSTELSFYYNNNHIYNSNNENQILDLEFFKNEKIYNVKNAEISKFKNANNNLFSLINENSNGNDFLVNNFNKKNDATNNKRSEEKVM